jgi:hypothetical protein
MIRCSETVGCHEYVVDMGQALADGEEQQSSQIFRLLGECGGARPLNPLTCGFRLLHNS